MQHVTVAPTEGWPFQRGNTSGTTAALVATAVMAVAALTSGSGGAGQPNWHLVFAMFAAGLGLVTYRYWKIEMVAGPRGVVIQNPLRRRTLDWVDIDRFEVAPSMNAARNGYAISVVRHDGSRITAMAGSGWRESEVAADVRWLNAYRVEQTTAESERA